MLVRSRRAPGRSSHFSQKVGPEDLSVEGLPRGLQYCAAQSRTGFCRERRQEQWRPGDVAETALTYQQLLSRVGLALLTVDMTLLVLVEPASAFSDELGQDCRTWGITS